MKIPPKISVIVIAHLRKDFIKIALESLCNQSFPKEFFEIIVVKNFIDKNIDAFIKANDAKNIYSEASDLGRKCIEGIENSNGEIIVFLEDDDYFDLYKLELINKEFQDDKIVYFHNGHCMVNADGDLIKGNLFSEFEKDLVINKYKVDHKVVGRILKRGISFNLSSIAIRRNILPYDLSALKGMNVAVDNFMFYIALASGKYLKAVPNKLTFYRVHGNNISLPSQDNVNVLLSRALGFLESDLYGYKAIQNAITDPFIRQVIECRIIGPKLNIHIINGELEITKQEYMRAIKCGLKMRNVETLILAIVGLLTIKCKFLGKNLYVVYLKRKASHTLNKL
jgi:glycosyltransferase involved in cell wall biosynthesis